MIGGPGDLDLRSLVPDGATVAVGGLGLNRKPMGLIRALIDAGVRDLTVIAYLGSLEVEMLLAAGAVRELHTAGTALDGFGLAPKYRAARQSGDVAVVEWSEGALAASLEAASLRLGSMPCTTSPRSEVVDLNPHLVVALDPVTGDEVVYAAALVPDVALVQGSSADEAGNVHIEGDPAIDALCVKAARTGVASVLERTDRPPRTASISRIWLDAVVVDPNGAWPTACHPGPAVDLGTVAGWSASGGDDLAILQKVVT